MKDHNWGKITADGQKMTRDGELIRSDFIGKLTAFVSILNGAQESINEKVILIDCEKYDLSVVHSASDFMSAALSNETLSFVEETVRDWMKAIELVICESEQVRSEADNIGPRAELDFWKKRTSKFNYLLDQFKDQRVKSALGILQAAKSKIMIKWRDLDMKITEYGNEARDNVKYLYTLEKFCDPLYSSDPVSMVPEIPGLINSVRMIHSLSRFYNTSERISSIFLKITNQMINTCKSYISVNGTQTVWSQPQTKLIKKIQDCVKLNQEYQSCFHKTKAKVALMPNERPFDFSEMYIFGKFDTFIRRCQKIVDIFENIAIYSKLAESKIEGMDSFANRFSAILANLRKKTYDFIELRTDFEKDYNDFKNGILEIHV
jgi:dynein heavy chain, axonemal